MGVGLTDPWANGATAVLYIGPRDIQVWPKLIQATGATLFAAVPSLYRQMLKYCALARGELASLRHGLAAGEALPAALLADWRKRTGREIYEALGMSECSTFVSTFPGMADQARQPRQAAGGPAHRRPAGRRRRRAAAGGRDGPARHPPRRPRPDAGLLAPAGGEKLVYRGEWFVGGDLAAFDDEGYLWYHGRADDLMNAGGYRVSPAEVEAALADHPGHRRGRRRRACRPPRCQRDRRLRRRPTGRAQGRRLDPGACREPPRRLQAPAGGHLPRQPAAHRQWQADCAGLSQKAFDKYVFSV